VASGSGKTPSLAEALFAPRSVALVGASGDAGKNTARPQRYLRKHGYTGKIYPVNPTRPSIFDETCFPSVEKIPQQIDHALIMVQDVESALEDCGKRGVPVASVYSDGFADAGAQGLKRQAKLVERARQLGVRLLGPNSMGVVNLPGRVALTVNGVLEMDAPPAGGVSLVSQSGTMLGTVLSRGAARGLGFAKLVSVGNEADLGVGELVELLAADEDTRVILLFLETIRDAAKLASGARKAHAAGKPIVAYKLGRSALGEALARSHTGALAGADAALEAFFRDNGILRVDMLETLIEIAPLVLGKTPLDLARKPRIAVVTTTGGGAASVVDRLGLAGIETVGPSPDKPIHDLTMAATPQKYRETLEKLLADRECDAVLATVGSSAQFHPKFAIEPILEAKKTAKPLGVFLTPHAESSLALLAEKGIAAFRTPEACADAFASYFNWQSPRKPYSAGTPLFEEEVFSLLESLGIPVVEQQVASAPDFKHSIPYPVAVKVLDAEHKTEVGGVALALSNFEEFIQVAEDWDKPALLVQRMESGLAEVIVGYRRDPVVGPVVLVGAGGTLTELYRDFTLSMAPVSPEEAMRMIERVRGLAVLRGYRNLPRGDVQALAQAVSALSRLCFLEKVLEAEINPLIVKSRGVVAVDALMMALP